GAAAIAEARRLLTAGAILAVKGIGGYHLACDAANARAVAALRERKQRGRRPFAVMAADLGTAEQLAPVSPAEAELLTGPCRPIVLLRRAAQPKTAQPKTAQPETAQPQAHPPPALLADGVCPGSPDIGVMLPYAPLHQLLFGLPGDPPGPRVLVMTSANVSGEPILTDDERAHAILPGLADAWLWHDRPIQVPCDDSVVRVRADGTSVPLRRSRGYAPLPLPLSLPVTAPPSLAVGGDLKNTICVAEGRTAWLSAHIGDMDSVATLEAAGTAARHLASLTSVRPGVLAADRHPAYRSTRWAHRHAEGRPVHMVQHHHAHIASAMADNGLDGTEPVIGLAFDGTGYGDDGAVWGGEVLLADYSGYRRLAHLAYVPLPGGDAAVRNPYRMALSHLRAAGIARDPGLPPVATCPDGERRLVERQLERGLACVPTSSMGRLFDAVSSLAGICHRISYEAQAAIELEAAAAPAMSGCGPAYAFRLTPAAQGSSCELLDPAPVLGAVVADLRAAAPTAVIAARFHHAVADAALAVCRSAARRTGIGSVALSGGVFGNVLLEEACTQKLLAAGFTVLRHRNVPCGDGGLALGQIVVAAHRAPTSAPTSEGMESPCAWPCPAR
ncbi:Sua5/YciO/YrdC/YwlC family protein, partial [Actinacidiphila oryziradicis]|uniref:Kae1-like domain-containing protein n=1 Tax=Actinacidiphila oryziradicis TaxID=2571141 RepID=UPI0023F5913C